MSTETANAASAGDWVVRRVSPTECERLQAFPDGYTDLAGCDADAILERMPAKSTEREQKSLDRKVRRWCEATPDGPRYKALGNSMSCTVMAWLAERIQLVDDILEEMGK